MEHACRVRRISDHDEIGCRGDLVYEKPEVSRGRQDVPLGAVAGREKRRLGFGELGVNDDWPLGMERTRDQSEGLGASGGGEYLIYADRVRLADRLAGCIRVRIFGQVLRRAVDNRAEPLGGSREADIDGQVDQPFGNVLVSVVVEIMDSTSLT